MIKKIIPISLVISLYAISGKAQTATTQDTIINNYISSARKLDSKFVYNKKDGPVKIVTWPAFDTLFVPILSNVFVGSNELTQNTAAASLVQDKDKGTVNVNYTSFLSKNHRWLGNIGAFSKSSEGVFGIYTGGSWNSEAGINLGLTKVFKKSQRFDDSTGARLKAAHKQEIAKYVREYNKVVRYDTARFRVEIDSCNKLLDNILVNDILTDNTDYKSVDSLRKDRLAKIAEYKKIVPKVKSINNLSFYEDVLELRLSEYEKKTTTFVGYALHWIGTSVALSNNNISLNTDSLAKKDLYRSRNLAKLIIGFNYNYMRSRKRILFYGKAGVDFGLRNYLDHPLFSKPGVRLDTLTGDLNVYNKNQTLVAPYNSLKADIKTFEPNGYMSFFFLGKKQVGIDARVAARIPLSLPEGISHKMYQSVFTLATGPVFRVLTKEAVSKGSVGLEVGLMDCPTEVNVWEYFGARLKIGVPFNSLIK
ncbi:hypothetical protein [Chitinophaga sp. S165]|uniref:hypothetical protein n=1 Tax=Chitinophaga sp. S165 TaxID=2135462 RepID=UPI000D7127D8|nr:hypothetical protein [Chitinophaga sp. S165]PWV51616.1 hypothetical protein C7475_103226 [Chitinophaga sp. S165]